MSDIDTTLTPQDLEPIEEVQQSGEPVETDDQGADEEGKTITLADARRIAREIAKEEANTASEATFRRAQSYADVQARHVKETVDQAKRSIELMRASNVDITEEREKEILRQAQQDAISNPPQPNVGPSEEMVQQFDAGIVTLEAKHGGTKLDYGDPELAGLVQLYTGDIAHDLALIDSRLAAKRTRLQTKPPPPNGDPARVPGQQGAAPKGKAALEARLDKILSGPMNDEAVQEMSAINKKLEAYD
mgnify:CR=1 FL=1